MVSESINYVPKNVTPVQYLLIRHTQNTFCFYKQTITSKFYITFTHQTNRIIVAGHPFIRSLGLWLL